MCKCVKPLFKGGTGRSVTHWGMRGSVFPCYCWDVGVMLGVII